MEAGSSAEALATAYETGQCHDPEHRNFIPVNLSTSKESHDIGLEE
jgi:hypothetical protein